MFLEINSIKLKLKTLTHGCLKVHGEVPIFLMHFLLILFSQGSIALSLENVSYPYSWIQSPDPHAMIPDLNINKQNITTLDQHIYRDCLFKAKTGRYAEFSFKETKSLSSYAGLSGYQPARDFTHNWAFIKYMST